MQPPTNPNTPPEGALFYTILEAANLLRVSPWTVQRLIQSRELASAKIGRRRLIPAKAMQTYIDDVATPEHPGTIGVLHG
jgi:excisionase family DNA binding protein